MVYLNTETEKTGFSEDHRVTLISPTEELTTPKKLHINFGNTKCWVTVGSGSPNSLITWHTKSRIAIALVGGAIRQIHQTYAASPTLP